MTKDILKLLQENPYPGRGIAIGLSSDGLRSLLIYFIMGRSVNSRNRVFEKTGDGIRTKAFNPSNMTDPSLVIYNPVRFFGGRTIVTNGDQTDTIQNFLAEGHCFRDALLTRTFEPDAPNYTPRISGIVEKDGSYSLSILKTVEGAPDSSQRCFFEYDKPVPGLGHFISTYERDGDPLPSFRGEPISFETSAWNSLESFAQAFWGALDESNRVSLYAQEADIASARQRSQIINKLT